MVAVLSEGFIKTQESPEVQLHYVEDAKNEKGPLVLMLHGFPEFWYAWKDYLAPLADAGFHPVALDLRGYNKSSHPNDVAQYEIDRLVEDIRLVIQKFDKKTYIVGHDWGGIITWELASRYPELCDGLVVINAPHRSAWKDNLNFKQMMKAWYTYAFQIPKLPEIWLKSFNFRAVEKILVNQSKNDEAYNSEDLRCYKNALSKDKTMKSAVNYYRANMKNFGKPGKEKIKSPTLLIWGEKDAALETSMLSNIQDYMDAPLTKRFFPEGSHWIHRERPKELVREIVNFFNSLQPV